MPNETEFVDIPVRPGGGGAEELSAPFPASMQPGSLASDHAVQFSSLQSLSRVRLFAIPWTTAHQASLSITNSRSLPKLMSTESVMPSNHLILCRPLLLLPSTFPSIRLFSNESVLCIRWPKYWSFSYSISPSSEYSGLISFRMDLLAIQETLKGLLQHHSSKASIPWCSSFFLVPCHIYTWLLEKLHDCWTDLCWQSNVSAF